MQFSQPQHEAEIESYGQQHFHRYQYLQQRKANDFTGIEQAGVSLDEESGEGVTHKNYRQHRCNHKARYRYLAHQMSVNNQPADAPVCPDSPTDRRFNVAARPACLTARQAGGVARNP